VADLKVRTNPYQYAGLGELGDIDAFELTSELDRACRGSRYAMSFVLLVLSHASSNLRLTPSVEIDPDCSTIGHQPIIGDVQGVGKDGRKARSIQDARTKQDEARIQLLPVG
jgi:hypothetical protein